MFWITVIGLLLLCNWVDSILIPSCKILCPTHCIQHLRFDLLFPSSNHLCGEVEAQPCSHSCVCVCLSVSCRSLPTPSSQLSPQYQYKRIITMIVTRNKLAHPASSGGQLSEHPLWTPRPHVPRVSHTAVSLPRAVRSQPEGRKHAVISSWRLLFSDDLLALRS